MATRGRRWPLMIDPQGQANRWVRAMESARNFKIVRPTDPHLGRALESAVSSGAALLLENVDENLDPILQPLLQKATFKQVG